MSVLPLRIPIQLITETDLSQTYSITLKKGTVNEQKLQVLIEFLTICRPYHALKILHTLGLNFMDNPEITEIDTKQKDALREVLNLFTGLWEAEHNQHDPLDLSESE